MVAGQPRIAACLSTGSDCCREGHGSGKQEWLHPLAFLCPISQQCMGDPVLLSDGHTYERVHIERWLRQSTSSPVTGLPLDRTDILSNHALRNAIQEYFQQVFGVHRRAISNTVRAQRGEATLVKTVDGLMHCALLVHANLSTESILRRIVDEAKALIGAERASVWIVDHESGELYSRVNSTSRELRIPLGAGIAGHVATTGRPEIVSAPYSDSRFLTAVDSEFRTTTRNMICVPLKVRGGATFGTVQVLNKTADGDLGEPEDADGGFSQEDLRFLEVFASQAATAVESSASDTLRAWVRSPPARAAATVSVFRRTEQDCSREAKALLAAAFDSWQLDTLALSRATGGRPLSTLGLYLFDQLGLVGSLGLDREKLECFFLEIERGYSAKVQYHNSAHAASVMHVMHAILKKGGLAEAIARGRPGAAAPDNSPGLLRVAACLLAAAAHDYEHLGLSNDFLVKSSHERAVRFNDRHVNENHHAHAALEVMQQQRCNFLVELPAEEVRLVRSLMIELIISTDPALGSSVLGEAQKLLDKRRDPQLGALVPGDEAEALSLLRLAIRSADLGHASLLWDGHLQWVDRLEEEVFTQGDRELAAGLPVSPMMDRGKPGLRQTQVGFFENVVLPLYRTLVRIAPAAAPVLDSTTANCQKWREMERAPPQPAAAEVAARRSRACLPGMAWPLFAGLFSQSPWA